MDTVNPQPLQVRPYVAEGGGHIVQFAVLGESNGVCFDVDVVGGGGGGGGRSDSMNGGVGDSPRDFAMVACGNSGVPSRTSELTIAFEGEVYVFPAVTPEKVQAVLLLLGGCDVPSCAPSSEFIVEQNSRGVSDLTRSSKVSRRIASLMRFREKRKERCFEKKIRYTCRKEVAQRMHRKNGQFASSKESCKTDVGNWDSSDGTPCAESVLRKCQHCGINEKCTPAMRRGPGGPRSLCNACGLMWANKGTLRDLSKSGTGRAITFDQNEMETTGDVKPLAVEAENSYHEQDGQGSPDEIKPVSLDSENPSLRLSDQEMQDLQDLQDMHEIQGTNAEVVTDHVSIQVENSSVELDEQEVLDEFTNTSGTEFDLPENFDDQISVFNSLTSNIGD
ncbi:hypothetical protein CsatB_028309 [Cannabis sativa]